MLSHNHLPRFKSLLADPLVFTQQAAGVLLRPYQAEVFQPLLASIRAHSGDLIHDDHLMADSLVAVLDRLEWVVHSPTTIIDPDIFGRVSFMRTSPIPMHACTCGAAQVSIGSRKTVSVSPVSSLISRVENHCEAPVRYPLK